MDYFTKELVGALKIIHVDLAKLLEAIQDHKDAIREHGETSKNSSDEPLSVIATLGAPVAIRKEKTSSKAKKIWKAIKIPVEIAGILAVIIYTSLTYFMWREMQHSTKAAQDSANAAQAQLEMSDRPWLKVSFVVQSPGITFKDGGMQFNILPRIENIGHSVATGVVSPMKVILADDPNTMFNEPLKQQKEFCDKLSAQPVIHQQTRNSVVIFPNDSDASVGYGLGLSRAEVDAAKDERVGVKGANLAGPKILVPIVYGCVDYAYGASERHHQTQFIFTVQQTNRTKTVPHRVPIVAIRANEPVNATDVVLVKYAFGGFFAN